MDITKAINQALDQLSPAITSYRVLVDVVDKACVNVRIMQRELSTAPEGAVLAAIASFGHGWVTKTELTRKTQYLTAEARRMALNSLVRAGAVRTKVEKPNGRSVVQYTATPQDPTL